MLFASCEGISKLGYYSGTGSEHNITEVGFQPRFLMVRRTNATDNWVVWDSVRGFYTNYLAEQEELYLNESQAQSDHDHRIKATSTGFSFEGSTYNVSGGKYIYYAHA